ncbi:MAG: hypothetical protein KA717_25495 [Woronichinia naegeliana WA131]|uniref:Uncharacterized protein n=1 Tax=Woronichinia naegeliana WA131 TaxID=2824559 RepID=A0A977L3I9_9CYAN|nr:MAG: hypothetical protein KA717_25495 [Woronichinia naegeliana WA131]
MSGMAGKEVKNDLLENHGRKVALSYIQRLSEAVGSVVQAKEEAWSYTEHGHKLRILKIRDNIVKIEKVVKRLRND